MHFLVHTGNRGWISSEFWGRYHHVLKAEGRHEVGEILPSRG